MAIVLDLTWWVLRTTLSWTFGRMFGESETPEQKMLREQQERLREMHLELLHIMRQYNDTHCIHDITENEQDWDACQLTEKPCSKI
jgi:hypothetical protein